MHYDYPGSRRDGVFGFAKNTRQKTEKIKKIIVKSVDVGKSICYSYQTRKDLGLFFMLKIR